MKKAEIVVGQEYLAKVSGTLQRVRVTRCVVKTSRIWRGRGDPDFRETTSWEAENLRTGRTIVIKSAQRLRPIPATSPAPNTPPCKRCSKRRNEYVLYLEAGGRIAVCGHCVPSDAVRVSNFAFREQGAEEPAQ